MTENLKLNYVVIFLAAVITVGSLGFTYIYMDTVNDCRDLLEYTKELQEELGKK